MKAFYSDHFVLPLPTGHRFPMGKYRQLRQQVLANLPQIALLDAPSASDGELALAHEPAYVQSVIDGSLAAHMLREIGFPWSPAMVERSRRSVGATIAAARSALQQGVGANLAGGTHHAFAARGGGFCVFNDVAVATRLMQAEWGRGAVVGVGVTNTHRAPLRVAVVDLDVHQGNGTAQIFAADDSVFTLSIHGARNYPFSKERSNLDVALPDGCGDADYLLALAQAMAAMEQQFSPGLVIYLAGADPHEGDRLGRLKLTFDGLQHRDQWVFDWCLSRHIPVAVVMAGGYGLRLEDTVQVQFNTLRIAAQSFEHWQALGVTSAGLAKSGL